MGTMIQVMPRSWSTSSVSLLALALCSSLPACVVEEAPKRAPLNTTDDDKAAVEQQGVACAEGRHDAAHLGDADLGVGTDHQQVTGAA